MYKLLFLVLFEYVLSIENQKSWIQETGSPVNQLIWCGASVVFTKDDEVVEQTHSETRKVLFVLTDGGRVIKSNDYGQSWIQEQGTLERLANKATIFFESIQISPADSRVVYILGQDGQSFRTKDCGRTYSLFNHEKDFYDFKLNKMDHKWIMAFKDIVCQKSDLNCKEYYKKSIHVTKDGGDSWNSVLSYVREASWDKLLQYQMVPDERMVVCHIKDGISVVSYSDDYFNTSSIMRENAQGYFQTQYYIFVLSKPEIFNEGFDLLVSPAYLDRFVPQEVKLPIKTLNQHSFTILDTSEGQIFLSVSHVEDNQRLTNIYVSDYRGFKFTLSLLHNVRSLDTGNCDFERLLGIEGVYIANVYDHEEVEKAKGRDDIPKNHLEPYKKSFISYDKGGNWHPLKAPQEDADAVKIICSGDCSLHLKGRTESSQNPIYSSDNSPGIAMGVGNTGLYLTQKDSEINTYLTRDGGHNWFEIRKGSHMYEIGDRGGIIVMGRDDKAVDRIIYSWDEGLTWEEIIISNKTFMIQNIVTEPSNMEQKFIVYGQSGSSEATMVGFVIALNFQSLHQRVCSGSWDPTMLESDYEFWIPRNFEDGKCVFGRKMKYIRRKRDAKCFNTEEMDKKFYIENCPCVEDDWECDFGFYRRMEGSVCVPISQNFQDDDIPDVLLPPDDCKQSYMQTQGYRKVSGDYCMGGIDLSPIETDCPKINNETSSNSIKEQEIQSEIYQIGTDNVSSKLQMVLLAIVCTLVGFLIFKNKIIIMLQNLKSKGDSQNQKENKMSALNRKNYEQISLFQNDDEEEL